MVALDESVGSGLTASERQPVFIVDNERFDLITTLSRCRENFAAACDLLTDDRRQNRFSRTPKGTDIVIGSVLRKFPAKYGF